MSNQYWATFLIFYMFAKYSESCGYMYICYKTRFVCPRVIYRANIYNRTKNKCTLKHELDFLSILDLNCVKKVDLQLFGNFTFKLVNSKKKPV